MTDTDASDIDDRILQRVRAMLAKAEATPFAEEAAVFTAKAHDLMATHAIDRAMVDAQRGEGTVTSVRIVLHPPYAKDKYRLLSAVATPNRCRAILGVDHTHFEPDVMDEFMAGNRIATVFGYRSDLDVVEMLFTSLLLQATNVITSHGSVVDEWGQNQTRAFRHSFLVSFAWTIGERLSENEERATTTADAAHHGEVLPVLADRRSQVDDAIETTFPGARTMTTSVSSHDGLAAGQTAGRRADVGNPRVAARRQVTAG
jgi:hypothetical protein